MVDKLKIWYVILDNFDDWADYDSKGNFLMNIFICFSNKLEELLYIVFYL